MQSLGHFHQPLGKRPFKFGDHTCAQLAHRSHNECESMSSTPTRAKLRGVKRTDINSLLHPNPMQNANGDLDRSSPFKWNESAGRFPRWCSRVPVVEFLE
jgi:hypothetical protein